MWPFKKKKVAEPPKEPTPPAPVPIKGYPELERYETVSAAISFEPAQLFRLRMLRALKKFKVKEVYKTAEVSVYLEALARVRNTTGEWLWLRKCDGKERPLYTQIVPAEALRLVEALDREFQGKVRIKVSLINKGEGERTFMAAIGAEHAVSVVFYAWDYTHPPCFGNVHAPPFTE